MTTQVWMDEVIDLADLMKKLLRCASYLLQLLVLSVHQGLPVVVELHVVSLDVLQGSFSQYGAVLHGYDLERTHQHIKLIVCVRQK